MNRTYALSKVYGPQTAITEAEKLKLENYHFYFALLGELYTNIDTFTANLNFQKALSLAVTAADKLTIEKKINKLNTP